MLEYNDPEGITRSSKNYFKKQRLLDVWCQVLKQSMAKLYFTDFYYSNRDHFWSRYMSYHMNNL